MASYGRLVSALVVILLLVTLFNVNSVSSKTQTSEDEPDYDGYIIEFNEAPILRFKNRLKETMNNIYSYLSERVAELFLNQKVQNHEKKLASLHRNAKEEILELIGGDVSPGDIFSNDFTTLFNGISIKNVPEKILNRIRELPYVKQVFPNYRITVKLDESVPLINADDIWKLKDNYGENITGKGVTIAFLDSGVNYSHPDLKDNYIAEGSFDFFNNDSDPMDIDGHGTHVAGIAVGKGNASDYRYVGVAPDAKFYSFKIIENDVGNFENYSLAMTAAVDIGVDIISMSFGTEDPGIPTDPFCQLADEAVEAGIIVVAAAGNNGSALNTITSPGCAQKVICVGATDKNDKIATFSSRGPVEWDDNYMVKPDVVAPGVSIYSCKLGGGYIQHSGTSMSTPHVAGAAALLLQANPDSEPQDIKDLLKSTAVDLGYDVNTQGSGRIDLLRALSSDDMLFINAPDAIYEKQEFTVSITNRTGAPVEGWIVFTVPSRLPKIKYGSSVTFKAPTIFRIFKNNLVGKIKFFEDLSLIKFFRDEYDYKKNMVIINNRFI